MEKKGNAPSLGSPGISCGNEPRDNPICVERPELGERPPALTPGSAPLDIVQIHSVKARDFVLVVGNLFAILNSTLTLIYCLQESHYAVMHGLAYTPASWQLGLIFGPIVGYNFLAWFLKFTKGH